MYFFAVVFHRLCVRSLQACCNTVNVNFLFEFLIAGCCCIAGHHAIPGVSGKMLTLCQCTLHNSLLLALFFSSLLIHRLSLHPVTYLLYKDVNSSICVVLLAFFCFFCHVVKKILSLAAKQWLIHDTTIIITIHHSCYNIKALQVQHLPPFFFQFTQCWCW